MNVKSEQPTRPDFVIIGAMKCATSTLHVQLAEQPGFFMSEPKEPNFFSDDDQYALGERWYLDLFRDAPAGAMRGESSTHYTKLPTYPKTIDRLVEVLPDARFVYIMRHPIDRLVSHYIHDWTERKITCPIDEAVDRHTDLIDYGCYAMQMRPWLDRFGSERILPVFLERLKADPQLALERVCRFLGYDGEPVWRDEQRANVSSTRLRKSKMRDLVVNAPVLRTIRRTLVPQGLRDRVKLLWRMKKRPELSQIVRDRLAKRFDKDLVDLGRWLGAELSCETYATAVASSDLDWVAPVTERSA